MVSASRSISLNNSSLQLLQPSAMLASESIAPRKLKIKLSKVSSEAQIVSSELDRSNVVFSSYVEKVSLNTVGSSCYDGVSGMSQPHVKRRVLLKSDSAACPTSDMKQITNKNKLQSSISDIQAVSDRYTQSSASHASKRGPVRKLESQQAKKPKIDSKVMVQCLALLKKLINDKRGWGFKDPVDPVAMNIPDYFSIISEPMDLGTIKSKLEKKLYTKTEEFATDVRLTFNNAMLYNPPANYFHVVAKELSELFESRWKVLESKWSAERLKATQQLNSDESLSTTLSMKHDSHRTQASCPKISENVSMTSVPKQKQREDLVEISKSKFSLLDQRGERITSAVDVLDEVRASKPQKVSRSSHHSRSVESALTQHSSGQNSSQKDLHEGIGDGTRQASVSLSDKSRMSSACLNGSCESMNSRVSHQNSISSDDVCVIDEDNCHPSSRPSTPGNDAALDEGWETSLYDGHLSPSKALRAAMLRTRFADTIVKAQQKTLLNNGGKSDPVKMKQVKERLERQQREEKARIEAQIRAAEAASRMREEMELKMQREREREAARIALQKMERTVEIYENLEILKDLEMLGAYSDRNNFLVDNDSPLKRLGLFMKDEYLEDEELETCSQVVEVKICSQVVEVENHSQVVEVDNCITDVKVENRSSNVNLENNNMDVEEGEIA
ncbi:hypothetical protein AQUCO_05700017v1 [Aquilegia coerulea]|uniref:Bromo domain-containing protein n=1 Tax=Aquilegia coerulea TaxID=218851 RepID=A0A2G5CFI6_AQUCA|nr:hypothetical protein AQUCO_05700017v1 [Aquilegia coerulea]PIA30020.1 hypothetical protein AQUCO_05700017v1 [Aquilegia coerulea]PIA30021.1 hypothetical protein AQUCO_05700017v1 [Aquilegia coerulea]PIA30022.1 hypothetical protein AQUCO_05700017v1 [Aquilegia coerulea]